MKSFLAKELHRCRGFIGLVGDSFGLDILNVGMVAKTFALNSYMIPILQPAHDMDSVIRVFDII